MQSLRSGDHGPDVVQLQQRLAALNLYSGPVDGNFTIAVETAVKAFQTANNLPADGVVGPITSSTLMPASITDVPVRKRCLALTGSFETSKAAPGCFSGLAGDFDGMGMSFGALQWNLGQGTLQPIFLQLITDHPDLVTSIFGDHFAAFKTILAAPRPDQLKWAGTIQDHTGRAVADPWKAALFALGQTAECQNVQLAHADSMHRDAVAMCERFGIVTERGLALLFDIRVQNGSIDAAVESKIRADFAAIPSNASPMDAEVARLRSIANRRAEAANPKFVEDVRTRKLTIANGQGTVHGVTYDLETQFGIRLQPMS